MPHVACPSCGERGKIPPSLVGARIKCKKCGLSFNVAAPVAKPAAAAGQGDAPTAVAVMATATATADGGIAVEGLDDGSWNAPSDESSLFKAVTVPEPAAPHTESHGEHASAKFTAHEPRAHKEYKILSSRDKIFEGKFELPRLEEALNFLARDGWAVKAMSTPHLKAFGEGMKEEIVILLER